jgi:hypothetical protein
MALAGVPPRHSAESHAPNNGHAPHALPTSGVVGVILHDWQGKSGLGHLDGSKWTLLDQFTEIDSGKRNDRARTRSCDSTRRASRQRL